MSRRNKINGICKLCGKSGSLSFEHVPPKAAFNNGKAFYSTSLDQLMNLDPDPDYLERFGDQYPIDKSKKSQGGVGFNTLCNPCNNNTGSWYGKDYVDWAQQCMYILLKANGKPTLHYPTYFFPLRVFKQVLAMFVSISLDGLTDQEPELRKFILNKEERFLDPKYKVYSYFNFKGSKRFISDTVVSDPNINGMHQLCEFSFPPFGFVFSMNTNEINMSDLTSISYFSNYSYDDFTDYYQKFNVLPTYLPFSPLDYRTREQVISDVRLNQLAKNRVR